MSTEHGMDGMAERLRPSRLTMPCKGKGGWNIIFSGFAKHSQAESMDSAATSDVDPARSTITCQQYR